MIAAATAVRSWLVGPRGALRLSLGVLLLAGCSITIREPVAAVTLPSPVKVVVTGNASYSNFQLLANGVDVSGQMVYQGGNRYEGFLTLLPGTTNLDASADVYCWYCGGSTHS